MKVKILFSFLVSLLMIVGPLGCDEHESVATLEGTWKGTKAQGEVLVFGVPTGFEEEDNTFHPTLEFKEGGVVVLTRDGIPTQGNWAQNGETLITSLNFETDFVDLSGTYTIQTLTDTRLILYYEKEGTFEDPDTEIEITGTLKATLSFDKQ